MPSVPDLLADIDWRYLFAMQPGVYPGEVSLLIAIVQDGHQERDGIPACA
jgi:hypothetical protein